MAVYHVPVIYDSVTKQSRPAGCCDKIDPAYIGFAVSGIIAQDVENALYVKNGRLMCKLISSQDGNMLRYGNDRAAFLDGNDVLSNAGDVNILGIDPTDKKVTLTVERLKAAGFVNIASIESAIAEAVATMGAGSFISTDTGNVIKTGSDGKLYIALSDLLSTDTGNIIKTGSDGKLYIALSDLLSADINNVLKLGSDGKLYIDGDAGIVPES